MLMALRYVAARFAGQDEFVDALHSLPAALAKLLPVYSPCIEEFALRSFEDAAFLGQGALYLIASETALKIMESSSSCSQFFHTLEFRRGPMSIVPEKVLVGALLSETGYAEGSAVMLEMKALGGCTLAIANRLSPEVLDSADLAIELALDVPGLARLVVYVVWGQLLGCLLGLRKGLNPDAPRHLTRVVTLVG
jgi:glutamine---fructose-6-phosphate transaminase (isomerizing)